MPTTTTHAPGTFNWPELMTSDPDGAKKFYTTLFGWKVTDQDMGGGMIYTIYTLGGRDVAAMFKLMPDMVKAGMPPTWGTYVTVESVDETLDKLKEQGGKLVMGPHEVMDHGRSAMVTDSQGTAFSLWQARKHVGVGVLGEPGALGWTQLNAKDTAAAKKFYPAVIGWKVQDDAMPDAMGGGFYTTWLKADGPAGGMMAMPKDTPAPSHWLPYFASVDVDASANLAGSLGAKTYLPPTDIPGTGRFAVLADPQGATFALIKFTTPA